MHIIEIQIDDSELQNLENCTIKVSGWRYLNKELKKKVINFLKE